jgi:ribosomal 30S subunit maturation factor RimM
MADQWLPIGRVRSVNVKRRELRIDPIPPHARDFEGAKTLRFAPQDLAAQERPITCRILSMTLHGESVVATLAAGVPRDTVARFRHARVVIQPEARKPRSEDAWHPQELIGMRVVETPETVLGTVCKVYETDANAAAVIAKADGGEIVLPLLEQVVARVDWEVAVLFVHDIGPYAVDSADES